MYIHQPVQFNKNTLTVSKYCLKWNCGGKNYSKSVLFKIIEEVSMPLGTNDHVMASSSPNLARSCSLSCLVRRCITNKQCKDWRIAATAAIHRHRRSSVALHVQMPLTELEPCLWLQLKPSPPFFVSWQKVTSFRGTPFEHSTTVPCLCNATQPSTRQLASSPSSQPTV